MSDVIQSLHRSDRAFLAVSFVLFALAGSADAVVDTTVATPIGTVLAIGGVYLAARFVQIVSRRRVAIVALGFWCVFLGLVGLHIVGLGAVSSATAGLVTIGILESVTLATLLLACSVTVFLGFREYGVTPGADATAGDELEDSDYSIR